ncbi:hypothetical protein [Phenylobacterium montanum]|uniref:Alpha-amylase n=1 Tax=Phenylobacterium montanum TaxID=2823693 RepID=A0A975G1W9_9CAUL|nr:hypothetical protein [Caulobacter sp. S6]QUD89350.1 hypothetical protein KCG34_05575 [Caulobacter sp. S6]
MTNKAAVTTIAAALAVGGAAAHAADAPVQPPAPLGVFGVDMPAQGKLVLGYAPSLTRVQGIKIDTDWVQPAYIVTHVPSPYTPVGNHLLRMVPESLTTTSQSFSLAYGLTPNLAVTASTALVEKDVDMTAFKGLSGVTRLGAKVGSTNGLGDTSLAAVVRLHSEGGEQVKANFGLSLPTGSTTDTISLLLPNGTSPFKRGFYAMQPGTGTVDALPGLTYSNVDGAWSWGAGYRGRIPLDTNARGWRYGNLHEFNVWGGYSWVPGVETTLRLNASTQGAIQGHDPGITGYAQGANPAFYGGRQLSLFAGAIVAGSHFGAPHVQLGIEAGVPLYQDLNGPQLARDWQLNFALRYKL